jgi:hypothetical protein
MNQELIDFAVEQTCRLNEDEGIPLDVASEMVANQIQRELHGYTGLGQSEEMLEEARKQISPWVWAFSLIGLTLAVINTRRIAKIYGGWKKGKRALKTGELPS